MPHTAHIRKYPLPGSKHILRGIALGIRPMGRGVQSNLYITVTLGKWPGDRDIQGDCCTQVSFKLPWKSTNSIFMCK